MSFACSIYTETRSIVEGFFSVKVFVTVFDDYTFAGNRFQFVQGLKSSFYAFDLIVSQQAPRRKGASNTWRGLRRKGNAHGASNNLKRSTSRVTQVA